MIMKLHLSVRSERIDYAQQINKHFHKILLISTQTKTQLSITTKIIVNNVSKYIRISLKMINNTNIDDLQLFQIQGEDKELVPDVPNFETEYVHAKSFLQKGSTLTGENLYDHLTEVLNKILSERPENVVDFFEEYSRKIKEKRFKPRTDHLEDIFIPPGRYNLANKLTHLLKPLPPEEPSTLDPEEREMPDMSNNNMLNLLFYFEQAGVGLPRGEMYCITMSMRQLVRVEPIAKIRFWGKIFGLYKNYLVLEAQLKEEEYVKRNEIYQTALEESKTVDNVVGQLDNIANEQEIPGEGEPPKLWDFLPPIPNVQYEEPPEPPLELSGVGVNKKVYYVCNEIGDPWVQLPDATPKEIRIARQIHKSFTGDLDQAIVTYPEFPGTERNYLRAQIARISASTHISPLGFYSFGGEDMGEEEELDEEAEAGGDKTEVRENPKYDPLPMKDLTDKSMMFWVHHNQHILNQGRTTWWNPNPLPEGLDEELGEEEEEARPITIGPEPETGPPLLTPCSEDVTLDAIPAWSVRCSSNLAEEYGLAIVRSNFWPGAFCFTTNGKNFENVYFGNALKFMSQNFSPTPLPNVEQDYPIGPEILEILDPTGAEEEAWRIAHLPKEKPPMVLAGEGAEEAEEEEDEDEDED